MVTTQNRGQSVVLRVRCSGVPTRDEETDQPPGAKLVGRSDVTRASGPVQRDVGLVLHFRALGERRRNIRGHAVESEALTLEPLVELDGRLGVKAGEQLRAI